MIAKVLRGVVRGKTIELDDVTGMEDGRQVEVTLRVNRLPGPPPRSPCCQDASPAAGMMAACWTEEDDRILEEFRRERKIETRREIGE